MPFDLKAPQGTNSDCSRACTASLGLDALIHLDMAATKITYDILENITEFMEYDTLATACRVSKAFYDAAARVLYRLLPLNPWDPRGQVGN